MCCRLSWGALSHNFCQTQAGFSGFWAFVRHDHANQPYFWIEMLKEQPIWRTSCRTFLAHSLEPLPWLSITSGLSCFTDYARSLLENCFDENSFCKKQSSSNSYSGIWDSPVFVLAFVIMNSMWKHFACSLLSSAYQTITGIRLSIVQRPSRSPFCRETHSLKAKGILQRSVQRMAEHMREWSLQQSRRHTAWELYLDDWELCFWVEHSLACNCEALLSAHDAYRCMPAQKLWRDGQLKFHIAHSYGVS